MRVNTCFRRLLSFGAILMMGHMYTFTNCEVLGHTHVQLISFPLTVSENHRPLPPSCHRPSSLSSMAPKTATTKKAPKKEPKKKKENKEKKEKKEKKETKEKKAKPKKKQEKGKGQEEDDAPETRQKRKATDAESDKQEVAVR